MPRTLPGPKASLLGALLLLSSWAGAQTNDTHPQAVSTLPPRDEPAMRDASPVDLASRRTLPAGARIDQRASRIVGATLYSEAGASIGILEDLIFGDGDCNISAILSVGGFLGIAGRLVAVPFGELRHDRHNNRWTLPSASRAAVMARPTFAFDSHD